MFIDLQPDKINKNAFCIVRDTCYVAQRLMEKITVISSIVPYKIYAIDLKKIERKKKHIGT